MFSVGQKVKIIKRSCGNGQMCSECIGTILPILRIEPHRTKSIVVQFIDGYCSFAPHELLPFFNNNEEFE